MLGIIELLGHTGSLKLFQGLDLWDVPVSAGDGCAVTGFSQRGVPGTPSVHGAAGSAGWAPPEAVLVRVSRPSGAMCSCRCGRHSSEKAVRVDQGSRHFASLALQGMSLGAKVLGPFWDLRGTQRPWAAELFSWILGHYK